MQKLEIVEEMRGENSAVSYFPEGTAASWVVVRFPSTSPRYVGFAGGRLREGCTGVNLWDTKTWLVVAKGQGYLASELGDEIAVFDQVFPIIQVFEHEGFLLLSSQTEMTAYQEGRESWSTGRIAHSSFAVKFLSERILCRTWDMQSDREVDFEVDLRTGRVFGGIQV